MFDPSMSHENIKIENGRLAFKSLKYQEEGDISVFGTMIAVPGNKYHWKLKVIGDDVQYINIGIIESDKCESNKERLWWNTDGISYFSWDGCIYKPNEQRVICNSYEYGKGFKGENEVIIDIWLDLKDENELSFAQNAVEFGKASQVKESMEYRLAVSIFDADTKMELLSCDVQY